MAAFELSAAVLVWPESPAHVAAINIGGLTDILEAVRIHRIPRLVWFSSLLVYAQGQIEYAVSGIRAIVERDLRWLDVRKDVQDAYNVQMQKRLQSTTWMSGCSSWYLTADGFNASMYPGFATQYLRQMQDFRISDYELASHSARKLWNVPLAAV